MKVLLFVGLVAVIHGSYATLLIKGPTEKVLEGDRVTLECVYADSDYNISQVHFEYFSKYMQQWSRFQERFMCFRMAEVSRTADSLVLTVARAESYSGGTFRCVSNADNVTEPDNSSLPLTFKVHYMREPYVSREGFSSYLGIPKELRVRAGDDVVLKCSAASSEEPSYFWSKEGSDWILPSSTLTLSKVTEMDGGEYTCVAQHSVESLSKKRSVSVIVLPEDAAWYETSYGRLVLMTSAAAASLLVLLVSMSVFLCRRAKQARSSKGPIDDHSQKKPIYKASVESLPSTCADKQPLV